MTTYTAEASQTTTKLTTSSTNKTSLGTAALIAGLALLIMVIAAPFAELFVFPKLIVPENAAETAKNILANQTLFRAAIFGYLITFICDLVAAWALYVLLKPVNENLSLLTAWCRLVYTIIAIVAFLNLVTVVRLLNSSNSLTGFDPSQFPAQVMSSLEAFRSSWYFGLLFFGIHLGLLGYLVLRSSYIRRILGVLLIIAGLGYLTNAIKPVLFPNINTDFAQFTFYGELIFMLWLLIRGSRIKE
jgi:Domain of unknown function (DUF4386)